MRRTQGRLFRFAVFFGLLLGVGLLVQSIETWIFVSRSLIRQEAEREAGRKITSLDRLLRGASPDDKERLATAAGELRRDNPSQVAWVRFSTPDGVILVTEGPAPAPTPQRTGPRGDRSTPDPAVTVDTPNGKALFIARPIRLRGNFLQPPPLTAPGEPASVPRPGRPPMVVAEVGVYLNGVEAPFGHLRATTAISAAAAIALLTAMLVIAFRFEPYLRGRQLAQELDIARSVQLGLLPQVAGRREQVDFAGECLPALQVGGDFYDVFGTGGVSNIVLGDVAGKGLPAALLSTLLQGAIRAAASLDRFSDAVADLNELLCSRTAQERFATLFWCRYDSARSELRYVNAGHLPPMLIRKTPEGGIEVRRLEDGGPVLGVISVARYEEGVESISGRDLLIIYSDGITEAADGKDEEFGEDRLIEAVRANWDRTPPEICNAVLGAIRSFLGGLSPHDDQTLVVVRLEAASQREFAGVERAAHAAI